MKIVGTSQIVGRGDAVITDEPFSWARWATAKEKKVIRVAAEGRVVEMEIRSAESALKEKGEETMAFVVRPISDQSSKDFIVGREAELI